MASDLRYVRTAVRRPHRCAGIPFIGMNHPEGYIDTATEFHGERVYISVAAVREMCRILGFPSRADYAAAVAERNAHAERIGELERHIVDLAAQVDAVDTLKSAGYTTARRPGRPRKTEESAAA